jgi:hypothetical protein
MQGGPLEHTIAAKATCFKIAMTDAFRDYQRQVRSNADVLCETLVDGGLDVLTGGTDTHLLQLDLRATEWTGKDAEERLHEVKLTVNRNTVPFDERPPTIASGRRDHRRGAEAGCRPRRAALARGGPLYEAAPVPGVQRLHHVRRVTTGRRDLNGHRRGLTPGMAVENLFELDEAPPGAGTRSRTDMVGL